MGANIASVAALV